MKRIHELDALRGIALLGILLVNSFVFHAPACHYGEFYGAFEGLQKTTVDLVVELATGKFLFIFAFLFGFGIVLQAQSRQKAFPTYFLKRMGVLFLFGTLHILLFWFGDILASYAVLGLLMLPAVRWPKASLLALGIVLLLFRPLYYFGALVWQWPLVAMGQPASLEEFTAIFQQGSYTDIFVLRMREFWAFGPENLVWYLPKTLGLFCMGAYAAHIHLFDRIRQHPLVFLIITVLLLMIGLPWLHYKYTVFGLVDLEAQPIWRPLLISANVVVETAIGFAYILGFTLLFQHSKLLTALFSKTGRMALTNYILQSLICVLIFYGYGLGYYGQLRPTTLVLLSLCIFGFNVVFSHLYLRFRSTGPLEWLWRRLING